jgi:transposase-like protein
VSKFSDASEGVAAAMRSGVSLEAAAEAEGVAATTVRGWLRRGRRESDGLFAEFVRAAQPPADGEGPMTVEEAEAHLVSVIREKRSVTAIVAWLRLHGQDQMPAGDDPLEAFMPAGSTNGQR